MQSTRFHYISLRRILIFSLHLILGFPSGLSILKFQTSTDTKRILVETVQPFEIRCAIHLCRQTPVLKGIIKRRGDESIRGTKLIFLGAEVTRRSEDEREPWRGREVCRSVSVRHWPAMPC